MSRPGKSYTVWILGMVLRALFVLLIIGICTMVIWRVFFSQRTPGDMDELCDNEVLSAAYAANGNALTVLEQNQVSYTQAADKNYAYFNIKWCEFYKEADQVQLVLFYNNSTLEHVKEDYGLSAAPPRGEAVFDLVLTQYVNTTPDKTGEERVIEKIQIAPTSCQVDTTSLYTFCRYTFDGVDLEETDTVVIYLDIFYGGDANSYGTLRLFHEESVSEERALTNQEKKRIAA